MDQSVSIALWQLVALCIVLVLLSVFVGFKFHQLVEKIGLALAALRAQLTANFFTGFSP